MDPTQKLVLKFDSFDSYLEVQFKASLSHVEVAL
jgi:hypothetical protein